MLPYKNLTVRGINMDIIVSARHMNHVSPAMRIEVESRLTKLSFYHSKLTKAEVVMDRVKGGSTAEIVLYGKGINIEAASGLCDNLYEAIHQAADRLEKQLKKKAGKRKRKHNSKHLGNLEVEILNITHELSDYEEEFERAQ